MRVNFGAYFSRERVGSWHFEFGCWSCVWLMECVCEEKNEEEKEKKKKWRKEVDTWNLCCLLTRLVPSSKYRFRLGAALVC